MSSGASSEAVIVLTTIGAGSDAAALAQTLVAEQLAACVNILPTMTSVYRWKGAVEHEPEQQLVIKTVAGRLAALEARVRELHSYEVPEFLVIRAEGGSDAYLRWIRDSVT